MSRRASRLAGIAADTDTATEVAVYFQTPEWHAMLEWLEFHGIDPKLIPAGTRVSRDARNRCIRYVGLELAEDGEPRRAGPMDEHSWGPYAVAPMVEQGEASPLPFPDLIARQL